MCDEQPAKTPSQELAEKAADMLGQAALVREKDLDELKMALGIGSATADRWLLWLDLGIEEGQAEIDE